MEELYKEAKYNNEQAKSNCNKQCQDYLLAYLAGTGLVRLIRNGLYLLQIAQIVEHVPHLFIAFFGIAAYRMHHDCRQRGIEIGIAIQNRGRILRNVLVHNSENI